MALSTRTLVGRLVREHVRPHVHRLGWASLFMALGAVLQGAQAYIIQPAIDEIFIEKNTALLFSIPLIAAGIAALRGLCAYVEGVQLAEAGQRIVGEVQVRMYAHMMHADLGWLQTQHSGKQIASFLYDATLLRDAVSRALTGMVKDTLTLASLVAVMFYQHWQLTLVVFFVFPLVGVLSGKLGRRTRKGSAKGQEETGRLTSILSETLDGVRLVKAYGMEAREIERTRQSIATRMQHFLKVIKARAAASPGTEALGGVAIAAAIFFGGQQAMAGEATLGQFTSFMAALLLSYQPLKNLANLNTSLQEGLAAAERVFATLDIQPAIADAPDAQPLRVTAGEVRFEGVKFSYDGARNALNDVSFAIAPGAKLALVGASGAGKSTILNLIPRFYEPTEGRVLIDGQDIRTVTLASLRGAMALVSQEQTLFDDSVRGNIAYGRPEASIEEIIAAARAADAHEFIAALPDGYDTRVGENGLRLSGGQRQRISIARAMLRDAPILLLDEATSALDAEAERKVQAALKTLMRDRTTIVIAHRLSTILDADEILVIDQGRVAERGRHSDLLARGGVYARLYATQFSQQAAQ